MDDFLTVGFSTWALTWAISFWNRTEWLREELGIFYVYDDTKEPIDREEESEFASWVNCPQCCVILTLPIAMLIHRLNRTTSQILAAIGLAIAVVRWYESLRPKARWWA